MKQLLQNITFKQSEQLAKMFGETAEKVAEILQNRDNIKTTQFRKFYDKVLELNQKAQTLSEEDFRVKVLPFVKMLNSKVAYAKTRRLCGNDFVTLMDISIKKVNNKEELQNFKYFLESIIGFMPKK